MISAMRFCIRDLFWLTVVAGLVTALWLERGAIERGDDARAEIPEPVHGGDRRLDDAGVGRAFAFV